MNESFLSRLAKVKKQTTRDLKEGTPYTERYIQLMKAEKKRISYKAAGELAQQLDVDPELLFVAHNLHALKNSMEAGEVETHEAMKELAHVLKVAQASPAVDSQTEAEIATVAKGMADALIAATGGGDTDVFLNRGVGGVKKSKRFAAGSVAIKAAQGLPGGEDDDQDEQPTRGAGGVSLKKRHGA